MLLASGEKRALFLVAGLLALGGAIKAHQIHETRWGQAFMGPPPHPSSEPVPATRAEPSVSADTHAVDLAASDIQVKAREAGETQAHRPRAKAAQKKAAGHCPVALNQANADELGELPGVGPKTAAAIIAFRQGHGPFRSLTDLMAVKGIGQKKLDRMRACLILSKTSSPQDAEMQTVPISQKIQKP